MNWDTNGRGECRTPPDLPAYQGKPMTRKQTLGYALTLRAQIWENHGKYDQAANDYHSAMKLYPEAPTAYNNFAWMIATKDVPNRREHSQEALDAALKSTSIDESANDLDTLACVYAFRGDTAKAIEIESRALDKDPGNADFTARNSLFQNSKDCTGQK